MKSNDVMSCITGFLMLFALILITGSSVAQPTPSELADRIDQLTMERIQEIDRLQYTNLFTAGILEGQESTSVFEKVRRNGRYVLEPVETDGDYETSEMAGFSQDIFSESIRHASSIEHDTYDGTSVYKVFVDDKDFLTQLSTPDALVDDEIDEYETEAAPKSLTFFIDRDDLLVLFASYVFTGPEGGELKMNMTLSEYENFSGLPIPTVTDIEIEGLEQMFADEDIAEAREAMREMEAQLEQMPEAQRRMIEEQFRPQIEQFEAILEGEDMENTRIEVTDVVVN